MVKPEGGMFLSIVPNSNLKRWSGSLLSLGGGGIVIRICGMALALLIPHSPGLTKNHNLLLVWFGGLFECPLGRTEV